MLISSVPSEKVGGRTGRLNALLLALSHPSLPRAKAISGEITDEESWAAPSFPVEPLHLTPQQPQLPIITGVFSAVRYQPPQATRDRRVQLGGFISHIGVEGVEQSAGMTSQRHHRSDPVEHGDGLGSGGGIVFFPVRITWKPTPIYTEEARYHKTEGEVVVDAEFATDRTVRILRFVQRLGDGLDEVAVEAVKAIRFKPASVNGEAVDVESRVHVEFHLFSP